jgi:methylenetetrahydrofolate dehydrogenase (NADP+)/methenyltetrahydrofolate cyclohydrolase
MAKILDGKKLAEQIFQKLKKEVKNRRLKLRLAIILVGDNPVSEIFVNQKKKACEKVDVGFKLFNFPSKIKPGLLKKQIEKIAKNQSISGMVIQLPLPKSFNVQEFLNLIPEEKDVDVLAEKSVGKFYQGRLPISPPTVKGILYLLKKYKIDLKGKNIVIVGAGRLVGNPLANQLLREKATLSVLNEFTRDTASFTKKADILVSAVGKPNLIKNRMVKKGAVIIDAGTSLRKNKLSGDVDFKAVIKKAKYITPVPGGVGPLTVACLLENLVKLNSTPYNNKLYTGQEK